MQSHQHPVADADEGYPGPASLGCGIANLQGADAIRKRSVGFPDLGS
jgi:hypothetical protein